MQPKTLIQLKQQIVLLNETEKRNLADFLADESRNGDETQVSLFVSDEESRSRQLEWLKANREKFAGKYVALVGDQLVGEGGTIREAREKALENGFRNSFLTRVYSETDVPFGGW